jgi:hypothetical protein
MKTFDLEYDMLPLCRVEIAPERAAKPIQEMVNFWSESEYRLNENGRDYLRTWLKQLGAFILRNGRAPGVGSFGQPVEDEGWFKLDGSHGIKVINVEPFEPDEDGIIIEEVS